MNEADHAWTLRISDAAADIARAATTPIASREPDGLQQLGMGTLFEIGASKFLVTAGHVVKESHNNDWPLNIFDAAAEDSPAQPVSLFGNACRIDEDAYDVALIALHQRTIEELPRRRFLHLQDVEIGTVHPGFFCIFGYPRNMAQRYVNGSEFYLVSSDNYFSLSATIRIPDRPCTEQGANDNYFSRSGRQSGLPSGSVSGYALLAG